jgi:catalase-peroxidase
LVSTAWASASTFRGSDKRGGANGARIRLAPQKDWKVNNPGQLAEVLKTLEGIQNEFNTAQTGNKKFRLPILSCWLAVLALRNQSKMPVLIYRFHLQPGRMDASQEQTDVEAFAVLEPAADGFRNYLRTKFSVSTEELLVDKAQLLNLTAPEMTVLVGGMRMLNANWDNSAHGVFTERPEVLTNDFFVNLLSMATVWKPVDDQQEVFEGHDRKTGEVEMDRHTRRPDFWFKLRTQGNR